LSIHELSGEVAMGFGVEGEDHEATRFHIEAMNGERAFGVGEEFLHSSCDAVALMFATPRYGEHACGFVDDDEGGFTVEDAQADGPIVGEGRGTGRPGGAEVVSDRQG